MSTCCDIGHPGPQGVLEDVIYPRGVDSARGIQVIETKSARGSGEPGQPSRTVTEYWSLDGEKLAENDPPYTNDASTALQAKRTQRMF